MIIFFENQSFMMLKYKSAIGILDNNISILMPMSFRCSCCFIKLSIKWKSITAFKNSTETTNGEAITKMFELSFEII